MNDLTVPTEHVDKVMARFKKGSIKTSNTKIKIKCTIRLHECDRHCKRSLFKNRCTVKSYRNAGGDHINTMLVRKHFVLISLVICKKQSKIFPQILPFRIIDISCISTLIEVQKSIVATTKALNIVVAIILLLM